MIDKVDPDKTYYAIHCLESDGLILEGKITTLPLGIVHIFSPTNVPKESHLRGRHSVLLEDVFETLGEAIEEGKKTLLARVESLEQKAGDLKKQASDLRRLQIKVR